MKISADKLKSLDYKKLALHHAEKLVAGLIGLLVVLIVFVPLLTGKFAGYDKTPEKLTKEAAETDDQIDKSLWPETEKMKYQGADDLKQKIDEITKPVSLTLYHYSIEVAPPLYRKQEPRKETDWLSVDDLLIASGRGHFEVPPPMETQEFSFDGSEGIQIGRDGETVIPLTDEDDQSDIPKEFQRRTGQRNAGAGAGAGLALGIGTETMREDFAAGEDCGESMDLQFGAYEMMQGEFGEGSGTRGPTVEGRGQRYALLRGVFNIRAQRERIAEALSIPEVALDSLTMKFDLLGFEVARKEGTGPWPEVDEEHEILDIDRSKQVLMAMAGFDFDPVGYGVTHQQITSPLPPRIVGEWGDEVVHPKISDYVLNTEEGKKLHEYFTDYLADRADQDKKLRDLDEKNTKFGFGTIQRNIQGFAGQVFGGEAGQRGIEDFSRGFQSAMGGAASGTPGTQPARGTRPTATQQQQIKSAVKRITAAGTLLLFRYFDFDVEPGKTYQYRVRLIFENPNFNVPVSELEDPQSRLGEIRKTPWSKLTPPITVLKDTEYFLAKVSVPPGRKNEESKLLMYQWKQDIGTVISSVLNSQLGQYIGGEVVTRVLKPALQTFEMEKVEFTSDDVLVDSSQGIDVNYKDHADLNLPKRLTGRGRRLRIMDEALVQDASGRLFSIDPFSSNSEKQKALQRLEWQNQPWQFLMELSEDGELGVGGCGGDLDADGMVGEEGTKKPRGRRNRFRRKNNKLKKNSAYGMGMGMDMDGM